MTIMFHIDNLLMTHKLPHIVTLFIKKLEQEYATHAPLTVTRGLVHDYLGMTFDLRVLGQVALLQYNYLKYSTMDYQTITKSATKEISIGLHRLQWIYSNKTKIHHSSMMLVERRTMELQHRYCG